MKDTNDTKDTNNSSYTFVYDDYTFTNTNKLAFRYHYEQTGNDGQPAVIGSFEETYTLPAAIDLTDESTTYILQQLHIIAGISYYKSLLGTVRTPYRLTPQEAEYYNTVYNNGLGEYAYVNKLRHEIKPFTASASALPERQAVPLQHQGALLGIGGGKDSAVGVEILKGIGLETSLLDVATRDNHGQAAAVMELAGLPQMHVGRYIDMSIIDFTKAYSGNNGHVPLSVILAWIGLLLAYSSKIKYVMMANEASTSIGNTMWNGKTVNHQWAKSYEAEKLTQDFVHSHISPDIWYFSPIRPYSSLAVMELFATLGRPYYNDFTSCNLVLRIDPAARPNGRWCTRCAKCLSTWLLLSLALSTTELSEIFGRNLLEDASLRPLLEALLGLSDHKPLDCVGTIEELRAAARSILGSGKTWPLFQGITANNIPGPSIQELVASRGQANIPDGLTSIIEQFVTKNLA